MNHESYRLSAEQILTIFNAVVTAVDGQEPSTFKSELQNKPRPDHISKIKPVSPIDTTDYWLSGGRVDQSLHRPAAYLRAYLALAGDSIPARGIVSDAREYLWLDKGVMKTLLQHGWVELKEGNFILTGKGRTALRREVLL